MNNLAWRAHASSTLEGTAQAADMNARKLLLASVALMSTALAAVDHPFDATTREETCSSTWQGWLNCHYRVGRDLEFSNAGVGIPDAGISFTRSNYTGDYYARFGVAHGCVVVAYGERGLKEAKTPFAFAFVSPRNGRVYREWPDCRSGE